MAKRIFLFLLTNIFIILTIGTVLYLVGGMKYLSGWGLGYQDLMIFCLIWGMGGAFMSLLLSRFMAKMFMGVQLIDPDKASGQDRELLEMVYRLARKAGLSTPPEVGIYQSEEVNAFATGPSKNRSLVAVSTGLFRNLNRHQVEGVLGHEVAHIANGDMVTMTLVQGVVNAFVIFLTQIIVRVLDQVTRDNQGRGGIMHGFLGFMLYQFIYSVLAFLAYPIVAAFSRYREFKADAGGARLAGREKMISALKALAGTTELVEQDHQSVAALKISNRAGFAKLFSTHPPIADRIKALERSTIL